MTTPLDKTIRRSLTIAGLEYVLTFSPESLKITRKGHQLGLELKWQDLISGESALAVALHASIGKFNDDTSSSKTASKKGGRRPKPAVRKRSGTRA